MNFEDLLSLCAAAGPALKDDSRKVMAGDIFVAIPGEDCAAHIEEAVRKGAAYVVCAGKYTPGRDSTAKFIEHSDIRQALANLAAAKWGTRENGFKYIGVTGTNGKTTSANMLESLFTSLGEKCGLLGTIKYKWPGFETPAPLTTPGALSLHEMLAKMRASGASVCVMEASSHALDQKRVSEIPFYAALFTNLTQDHLDYHKDMETYFRAKARLFLELPQKDKALAINRDDPWGRRLLELLPNAVAYGIGPCGAASRALKGEIVSSDRHGLRLKMSFGSKNWEIRSPLVGEFNAMNLLGVQALALAMDLKVGDLAALEDFHGVSGRLERIPNPQKKHVFVDYAHTPDALINVLKALRKADFKRIITVFGCGGNRDKSKRPLMGKAVADYSDIAVLTSDNPRKEDPERIMADVLPGLAGAKRLYMEADRRKATETALGLLEDGDALLIAGKGHEDYQIIGDKKRHYSDQETVRELLGCA